MARSFPLILALLFAACSTPGPTAEKPWVLVLSEAPTPETARQQAEKLAASNPALEGASGVTVRGRSGGLRHLLLSPPQADAEALRHLRAKLAGGKPLRLESLDIRTVDLIAADQAFSVSPPEQVEDLEQVARLLPSPGQARLLSFLLAATPSDEPGPLPHPPARSGRISFSLGFGALGWKATGEATYGAASGQGRVHWFVGYGGQKGEALKQAYNYLLAHVHPEPAIEPAPEEPEPKKGKRKRGKKKRRKRRPKPEPPPEPEEEIGLVPVAQELPDMVMKTMPWGQAEVVVVERVGLRKLQPVTKPKKKKKRSKRRRRRKAKKEAPTPQPTEPLMTAWLCAAPDGSGVVLILFDDAALVGDLVAPAALVAPSGLAHSGWVTGIWAGLPEITLEGERFEYLAMRRLAAWLPKHQRRAAWAKPLADKPVLMAGYQAVEKGSARWQLNWLQADQAGQAQALFEQGLVAPRQALMQRVLNAKRAVSYEVGITLRETGDVQAWHLNGADRGRLQELYFQRGRQVWVVRAGVASKGGLSTDGLQGRVELLQIWDNQAI